MSGVSVQLGSSVHQMFRTHLVFPFLASASLGQPQFGGHLESTHVDGFRSE